MRRMKRAVVWPKVSSSPPSIISRSMGAPSSRVPLVEPRSSTTKPLSEREILACLLETLGSFIDDVVLLRTPNPPRSTPFERVCLVAQSELHDLAREAVAPGLVGGDGGGALLHLVARILGAEDAGLARGVLRGPLLARSVAARQLGRHAELPEAEGLFRLEAYSWRGHQVVVLVLGVGGGVLDQLLPQGGLVGLDGLGVFPGEVDRKVVRGVGAGDRNHPALVHLLGEALGDLHRVDLPPERPSKDALDQRLHPLFDVFEETQKDLLSHPHRKVPERPVYYSREAERNHIGNERPWRSFLGDE